MAYIHQEGYSLIFTSGVLTLFVAYAAPSLVYVAPLAFTLFLVYFFRDPERTSPTEKNIVTAPADGTIKSITESNGEKIVHIFLSPWNVHINRAPIEGVIKSIKRKHGKKHLAFSKKLAENEENTIEIRGQITVVTTQIVGMFARRIRCWVTENDTIQRGERFGMIKFGSGTRLKMPASVEVIVNVDDQVRAGETIIARYA